MENEQKLKKQIEFLIKFVYWGIWAAVGFLLLKFAGPVLLPFFIAFLIAWMLSAPVDFAAKKLHIRRNIVAVAAVILFYALLGVILYFAGSRLILLVHDTFYDVADFFSETVVPIVQNLFAKMEKLLGAFYHTAEDVNAVQPYIYRTSSGEAYAMNYSGGSFAAAEKADRMVTELSGNVISSVSSMAAGIPGLCVKVLLSVIATVFIEVEFHSITAFFMAQIPKGCKRMLLDGKKYVTGTFFKCIVSYVLILGVTFAELTVGLFLLGVEGAAVFAFLIAVLDILPVLGTGTILVPWAVICFATGDTGMGAGILVLYLVITVVRNIVEPKLVGKQMGLSPVVMLPSMLLGLKFLGLFGLFAVPLAVALLKTLNDEGVIHIFNIPES